MKAIILKNQIKTENEFGNIFDGKVGFKSLSDERKEALGFRDIVIEPIKDGYKRTTLYYDNVTDKFYYKQKELTVEEKESEKKKLRDSKLKEGVVVQDIWFNEDKLTQFTITALISEKSGLTEFEWGKESGWGTVLVTDAFSIAMEVSKEFSKLYKNVMK